MQNNGELGTVLALLARLVIWTGEPYFVLSKQLIDPHVTEDDEWIQICLSWTAQRGIILTENIAKGRNIQKRALNDIQEV